MDSLLQGLISAFVSVPFVVWIIKLLLDKKLDALWKHRELLDTEVIQKRAEILEQVFTFCKTLKHHDPKKHFELGDHLHDKVMCWFPDRQCVAFRDFLAMTYRNPKCPDTTWHDHMEPLLADLITAIRPSSRLATLPGVQVNDGEPPYRFLPRPTIDDD